MKQFFTLFLAVSFCALSQPTRAQDGTLDPTFGNGGSVNLGQGGLSAFQSNGKFILVQWSGDGFSLTRYTTDGIPDASFGSGGTVVTHIANSEFLTVLNIAVQDDGHVAVQFRASFPLQKMSSILLARFTNDGVLDAGFGSGGYVTVRDFHGGANDPDSPLGYLLAVQKDGKILSAINIHDPINNVDYVQFIRYNTNGTQQGDFGGAVTVSFFTHATDLTVGDNGKIFVGLNVLDINDFYVPKTMIVGLNGDGSTDGGFNRQTTAVKALPNYTALAVQNDGKVLAKLGGKLERFNTDATLDASFGSGGVVLPAISFNKILVQSDGKIILGGGLNGDFALARYNPNGTPDASFGSGGKTSSDFGGTEEIVSIGIGGNRLLAYGNNILAAYRLNSLTPCTPPTFLNNQTIVLDASKCGNDGNISIIPLSGTAPFLYSIDGGTTYVAGGNAGHTFQELAAGTYQLRLKDANGCESAAVTREVRANVYPCNQAPCTPPTFLNNSQIVLDASCNGGDGNISIIPTSGTGPFLYSIDGGATYVAGPNAGYTFQNLAAGTYQLRLKAGNGCESAVITREVKALITVLPAPQYLIARQPTCANSQDGLLLVALPGRQYTDNTVDYSIDNGATYQHGGAFNRLSAGTYQIKARIGNCSSPVVSVEVHAIGLQICLPSVNAPTLRQHSTNQAVIEFIKVYPNPSRGQFNLQLQGIGSSKVQVQILDSRGAVLQTRSLGASEGGLIDVNLTGKAKGLYFVRVISDKGVQVQKVTVQ